MKGMMMATKKSSPDPDLQPSGSGAVPGSAQGAEELSNTADQPPYTNPKEDLDPLPEEEMAAQAEALEPTEADAELAKQAEEEDANFVGYHGGFTVREITMKQWQDAGVRDQPSIRWDKGNRMRVPKEAFTPQALQVLRQDPDFRVP